MKKNKEVECNAMIVNMGGLYVAVAVFSLALPISLLVNHIVPHPYMDEIFHIPQAQKYCQGNFSYWDPMITTLPGLYCVSLAYISSLYPVTYLTGNVTSFENTCSSSMLRSANLVMAAISSVLFYHIIITLRPATKVKNAMLGAIVISLYPLHWFFTFLFYTDVGSTTAVMAMYLASLKKYYWLSALLGGIAVTFRQTNIIWVAFAAFLGLVGYLNENISEGYLTKKDDELYANQRTGSSGVVNLNQISLRRRNKLNSKTKLVYGKSLHNTSQSSGFELFQDLGVLTYVLWRKKWNILATFSPFFLVAFAFLVFVIYNGSIVVGAKDAHIVSLHFAQVLYFGLTSGAAMAPLLLNIEKPRMMLHAIKKGRSIFFLQLSISFLAAIVSVHYFSLAHPYLLADNRHYPFYFWRKIIQRHWSMKYLLIPAYLYSWWAIFKLLEKTRERIWIFAFFMATVAVLAPTPLIEFRYYTIPFYLIILHTQIKNTKWLVIGFLYIIVNCVSMYLFLLKPFHWDHEPGTQRFMW